MDLESELSPNSNGINGRRRRRSSINHGHSSSMPSITIANFKISIIVPPSNNTSSSIASKLPTTPGKATSVGTPKSNEKKYYMVTLELKVPLASEPPNWPPTVSRS